MLMAIFSASISILCIIFYLGIMAYLHIANKTFTVRYIMRSVITA